MKMSFEFEGPEEVLRCIKGLAEGWTLGEFFSVKKPAKDSSQEPAAGPVFRKAKVKDFGLGERTVKPEPMEKLLTQKAKERKQREKKNPSPPI